MNQNENKTQMGVAARPQSATEMALNNQQGELDRLGDIVATLEAQLLPVMREHQPECQGSDGCEVSEIPLVARIQRQTAQITLMDQKLRSVSDRLGV